jgi:predicted oxidoreductase
MKHIQIKNTNLTVPVIAVGCMRIAKMTEAEIDAFVNTSLEAGMNFFDHADIYAGGKCEEVFGLALKKLKREDLIIQSKCGINPGAGTFDFSKEHILSSVDGSLKRLGTDYLDMLLLHRPDALCEPEEVADAFDTLHTSGKVRNFGVSNQNPYQIELLKKYVKQPLVVNQLQLSITNAAMLSAGMNVNMENASAVVRDGGILDYCRLNGITIQPWSPFQYGFFEGVFLDNPKFPELNKKIDELCEKYSTSDVPVTNSAMAIAWLLRHPAKMQPVLGTTNKERIKQIGAAAEIELTREEWYGIFKAAGNVLP